MPGPEYPVIGVVCGHKGVTRLELFGGLEVQATVLDTDRGINQSSLSDSVSRVVGLPNHTGNRPACPLGCPTAVGGHTFA